MGAYLSAPKTNKDSGNGEGRSHSWGYSEMQGWRTEMEDAHIAISDLGGANEGVAMFGVYDGHGGCEVAKFVENHLPKEMTKSVISDPSAMGEMLVKGYHRMDDLLRLPEYEQELAGYRREGSTNGEDGKSRIASLLQSSIEQDLAELRDRGTNVSRQDTAPVMMKMFVLKKLEAQAAAANRLNDGDSPTHHNPSGDLAGADDGSSPSSGSSCTEGRAALFGPSSGVLNVGCTAVTALLTKTHVIVANAGDSRAVLCRGGQAVELSHDHKPNSETERARIEAAGGYVEEITLTSKTQYRVNGNLNLSRAIGDHEYKKRDDLKPEEQIICSTPDIIMEKLTPADEFFVLACDGVWDVMSNEDVVKFIRPRIEKGEKKLSEIVEELLDHCIADDPKLTEGLGGDNMTCILVKLNDDGTSSTSISKQPVERY